MIKRLGKKTLKTRWEILTGEWILMESSAIRPVLEMLGETFQQNGIPWNVKLISTKLSGLASFGLDAIAPGSASNFGNSYGIFVPKKFEVRAKVILDNLKK
ncbi:hypothetical protein J7L68_03650 [bacterium]|nr:hypothetical protein [bacterium]